MPGGFINFDRIVVDEIQDLTLLEMAVVVELCRAIARHREYAPWLLLAGDEGQTVRPSGFEWGRLKKFINDHVASPYDFYLEDNLRCPHKIAEVIERASEMYTLLKKGKRPSKQNYQPGGQYVEAHLFHVAVGTAHEANKLLEDLDNVEGVIVLSPQDDLPNWIDEELQDMVTRPAEAKGLEYQSVCLLDPGRLLTRIDPALIDKKSLKLEEQERRTTIDQLRVALSRATETLTFIDVEASDTEQEASLKLIGKSAPFEPEDLIEYFTDEGKPIDEQVLVRTNDARSLIDERPRRAWRRVYQALRLLGDPNLPNGVSSKAVRHEVHITVLATAARLLVDGIPPGVARADVFAAVNESLKELDSSPTSRAFKELETWLSKRTNPSSGLLDAVHALDKNGDWLRAALVSVAQELRHSLDTEATIAVTAKNFSKDVESWLSITGYIGDIKSEGRLLRCKAVDTLIEARDLQSADQVLARIHPDDHQRIGRLREMQGNFQEAAAAFEQAGASNDALRNWRMGGRWENSIHLADGDEKKDLEWLVEITKLMEQRPSKHVERLTLAEQKRLKELLNL